jgi:hypothetical protein
LDAYGDAPNIAEIDQLLSDRRGRDHSGRLWTAEKEPKIPENYECFSNAYWVRYDKFEKRNEKWAKLGDFTYHLPDKFRKFLRDAGYSSIQIDVLESENRNAAMGTK